MVNTDAALAMLHHGTVIPAHPLALNAQRQFDMQRQQALSRYYLDAGVGGLAVGVHTTQFAIRDCGLYRPVLESAMHTALNWEPLGGQRPLVMVAGLAGNTHQAEQEAQLARDIGYHAGLLSLAALRTASDEELLNHCQCVARYLPLVGFYLQPAVGGRVLSAAFWEAFARIEQVVAIKVAPFHRYRTLDVVRGVVAAGAQERITLYTGNDDHILLDLLTPWTVMHQGDPVTVRMRGGLLGHWSVWTQRAVSLFARCQEAARQTQVSAQLLALDAQVTDCNSALFDVVNDFAGCIAGCHEVLRRQGLLEGIWCLDPKEGLSTGQAEQITRVSQAYPHLCDDDFVRQHRERWLS
ncbi:MAG: dihydrodipicolinate synthase family protein [Burkholderiaceae bacterium]